MSFSPEFSREVTGFRRDVPPPHPEIISKMIVVIILLLTFNLPLIYLVKAKVQNFSYKH